MAITIDGTNGLTTDNAALKLDGTTLSVDDTNNRVGVGTSSPDGNIHVYTDASGATANSSADELILEGSGNTGLSILTPNTANQYIFFGDPENELAGVIQYNHPNDYMRFYTDGAERMRIIDSGKLIVANTSSAIGSSGFQISTPNNSSGTGSADEQGYHFSTNGTGVISSAQSVQMQFNDTSAGGGTHNYIVFRYRGSTIGDIDTTNNSTIRYNTFTGGHWTQFADGTQPTLLNGTVLSTIDDMLEWTEYEYTNDEGFTEKTTVAGHDTIGSTKTIYIDEDGATASGTALSHDTSNRIAKCKVSDVAGDSCVYGVFAGHYKDGDTSVESLGLGIIRIGSGVTVQRGDLLESAGNGTARPQTGDNADLFKAGTIAKVTSTTVVETYDDGSYTVPCTLHCG